MRKVLMIALCFASFGTLASMRPAFAEKKQVCNTTWFAGQTTRQMAKCKTIGGCTTTLSGRRVVCQYEVLLGRSPAWLGERHRRSKPQHSLQTQLIQQQRSAGARIRAAGADRKTSATQANQEFGMRKALIIALGLASLGAFTQRATAEAVDCARQYDMCILDSPSPGDLTVRGCEYTLQQCTNKNAKQGRNIYGLGDGYCPKVTNGTASGSEKCDSPYGRVGHPPLVVSEGTGGGSRPKPGAHRTADGGTIMVTPEGKEWVWNGKTTTVVLYSRSNSAVYITVMQGDPDVSLRKTVNGRSYNVADPAYDAAIKAEQAKAGGSKGGAKGGPKVGYHPPAGLVSGGVATFNAPAQPTPVAGSGAVGTGAGTNASAQKTLRRSGKTPSAMCWVAPAFSAPTGRSCTRTDRSSNANPGAIASAYVLNGTIVGN